MQLLNDTPELLSYDEVASLYLDEFNEDNVKISRGDQFKSKQQRLDEQKQHIDELINKNQEMEQHFLQQIKILIDQNEQQANEIKQMQNRLYNLEQQMNNHFSTHTCIPKTSN